MMTVFSAKGQQRFEQRPTSFCAKGLFSFVNCVSGSLLKCVSHVKKSRESFLFLQLVEAAMTTQIHSAAHFEGRLRELGVLAGVVTAI